MVNSMVPNSYSFIYLYNIVTVIGSVLGLGVTRSLPDPIPSLTGE
jgi:hypothetical protein